MASSPGQKDLYLLSCFLEKQFAECQASFKFVKVSVRLKLSPVKLTLPENNECGITLC